MCLEYYIGHEPAETGVPLRSPRRLKKSSGPCISDHRDSFDMSKIEMNSHSSDLDTSSAEYILNDDPGSPRESIFSRESLTFDFEDLDTKTLGGILLEELDAAVNEAQICTITDVVTIVGSHNGSSKTPAVSCE